MLEVAKGVVQRHGAVLTPEAQKASLGCTPLDAWQAVIDELHLENVTGQQLFEESEPLLVERWLSRPLYAAAPLSTCLVCVTCRAPRISRSPKAASV